MELKTLLSRIDADTARAFVEAARHVIDAMLIEGQRVQQTQTPAARDYANAALSREAAPGGWASHVELRETARRLGEAVAAEQWTEGVLCALRALNLVGGLV